MIRQTFYTIKNSLREKPFLYALILITQTVSVLCVFFCYGLVYNAFSNYQNVDSDSRCFSVEFIDYSENAPTYQEQVKQLQQAMNYDVFKKNMAQILELLKNNRYDINVYGYITIDGKTYDAGAYFYTWDNIPEKPFEIRASVDGYAVGDEIVIDGNTYFIHAPGEADDITFHHGENAPTSFTVTDFLIEMERQPTALEAKKLADKIDELFHPKSTREPEIPKLLEIQLTNTQIILSAVIMVIAALNCSLCYNYINQKRRQQFAIFRLCGARGYQNFAVCMAEVILYMLVGSGIAYILFKYGLSHWFFERFPLASDAFTNSVYAKMFGMYAAIMIVVMFVNIVRITRRSVIDERRERN